MNLIPMRSVLAIAVSCVLASNVVIAQTSKGALAGIAKDRTGAVVSNTTITIKGEQTGETRTFETKADGSYRVDALSPEQYTVSATHEGFSGFSAEHVVVGASTVTTYNVTLNVGSGNDTITVNADTETINTVNGQLAGTISATELARLPILTLNPIELASTVAGVQTVPTDNQLSNGVNIQVDGARPRSNNFLLDSQEINDIGIGGQAFQPNIPDLYQDLTVLTSVASAEYGRSGGGVFNLVTKSGTNQFHGSAYDRYTSNGLNAVPNSRRGTDQPNARQTSHTIGFTLGGFLIKDKLFGYGGAQFQRFYGTEQIAAVTLPTAAGVATLASLTNATARAQVARLNQYTTNNAYLGSYSQVTNQPTSLVNIGVQPGCAASAAGGNCSVEQALFQRPAVALQNPDTQWSYRVDYKPWDKDSFYFRYLHDRTSLSPDFFANPDGAALGLDTQQGGTSELGAGSWTHVFTGNTINELRASETRINFSFSPLASTLANPAYSLPLLAIDDAYPTTSLGPQTGSFPQGRAEDLYQVQDTFTYTHGRQSIRAGFDIGHQLEKDTIGVNAGTINYAKGGAQSALQNFLADQTGASGSITKTIGPRRTDPHVWRSGFFMQDDVKFAPNFSVNLGMRYDYTGNPENSLAYPGIDERNPYAPITTVVPVKNDKNNLSPRIGFAYTPNMGGYFGSGKTVLRGGFGMFYDSFFSNFVTNAAQSAPNAIAGTLTSTTGVGVANSTATLAGFTPTLNTNASQTTVASNLKNPVSYQYNLGLEQEVAKAILAVRYVGVRSYDLFATSTLNPFSGITGNRLSSARGAISVRDNAASGNYNGLQTEFSRRIGSYLSIRANYTFSKSLDNGSEIFALGDTNFNTSAPAILGPVGRSQEYGPSTFDHRHYASITYVFTPKGYHVANKFADTLLGALTRNYTISGVEQFQSGSYSTFNLPGRDNNGDGNAFNDRPILGNPGQPFQTVGIDGTFLDGGNPGVYYDLVANNATGALNPVTAGQVHFLIPDNSTGQFNNRLLGRNTFQNPGTTRNDISIQKGFGTGLLHLERGQLLLRMDVQNLANHNDRGPYLDTNLLDYGLGPTSFETQSLARQESLGRQIYLWGKFTF